MTKIGLQFPDELLPSSVTVFKAIQRRIAATGAQAYVLADSTYGRYVAGIYHKSAETVSLML